MTSDQVNPTGLEFEILLQWHFLEEREHLLGTLSSGLIRRLRRGDRLQKFQVLCRGELGDSFLFTVVELERTFVFI